MQPLDLVLLALRSEIDPAIGPALDAALAGPLDWAGIRRIAIEERVAPLLWRALRNRDGVPAGARSAFTAAYHQSAHRNLIYLHELRAVLAALATAGVPVLVLKGAALGEMIYPNIAVRPLQDVDLLIRGGDLGRALAALATCGFALPRPETRPGAAVEFSNECIAYKDGATIIPIELHWSLFDSPYYQYALDMGWFWQTAVPARIVGTDTQVLGREALLLHLCGHLRLHHGGEELLWLHDVAQLMARLGEQLDWTLVCERASRLDLVLPLQTVLERVVDAWRAPIPAAALSAVRALRPSPRERRVFDRLTGPTPSAGRRFWSDLADLPGWSRRAGFVWASVFPSAAYMRSRYRIPNPLLLPLYYPYRWLRGVRGTAPE